MSVFAVLEMIRRRLGSVLRKFWAVRAAPVSVSTERVDANTALVLRAPPLSLDIADHRAWLGDRPIELGPKSFALLRVLMEAPQRLVTKDHLIETVWDGRFVSEAVLTTAMRDLRRAIGDDARAPMYIATVHGRGYRFLMPVAHADVVDATTITPPTHKALRPMRLPHVAFAGLVIVAGALAGASNFAAPTARDVATASDPATIAVLPFDDLSAAADQRYFSDGLAEEILNVLMGVEGLAVASRSSSFAFRDRTDIATPEIARELGVRHVLEGSVRKAGDRVRISVQLIDAQSDRHIWSRTYERALTVSNLFEIQDEVAEAIARELEAELDGAPRPRGAQARSAAAGTQNLQAYEYYLRARELFLARSDLPRSARLARDAVDADPNFARGWELLAAATFAERGRPSAEARQAVARALQLDPALSLSHALKGVMGNYDAPFDWAMAVGELEHAVTLDPTNTTALLWLGVEMHKLGYLDRAKLTLERCLAIDPAYDRCRLHLMWTEHMRGDTDRALAEYRRLVRDGAPPDDATLLLAAIARGDEAGARAMVRSLSDDQPMPDIIYDALRNPARDRTAARRALRAWVAEASFNRRDIYPIILEFEAYDLMLDQQGSSFGLWFPEFPEFRRSPAFKRFVRRMRIDAYWRAQGFPPQCRPVGSSDFVCA